MGSFDSLKSDWRDLEKSDELKSYLASHHGAYLSSAFFIAPHGDLDSVPWNLSFYWKKNNMLTTFVKKSSWSVSEEDEVLQKVKSDLPKLEIHNAKFSSEQAMTKIDKYFKENTIGETLSKVIVILNAHHGHPSWNITVFTKAFKVYNFKLDAVTGEMKESKVENLLAVGKQAMDKLKLDK